MFVALIASFLTNPTDPASVDPKLLSPVIRRFLPKKVVRQQDVDMALLSGYKVTKDTTELSFVIGSVSIKYCINVVLAVPEIWPLLKRTPMSLTPVGRESQL
jgi:hypothetical protein